MAISNLARDFLNRARLTLTRRFNRFFYDHVYYSTWLAKNLKYFNLGVMPVDSEIMSAPYVATEKNQAQVYYEAVKAYNRHASDISPHRVLEISSGLGGGLLVLSYCFPHSRIFGLDYSQTSVRRSHQLVEDSSLVVADAQFTPFQSSSFALLVNVESLHALNMSSFFREARRIITDDGLLVVVDFRKMRVKEVRQLLDEEANAAGMKVVEFLDLTRNVIESSLADTARRREITRRVPFPFRKWVNEMTAGVGSDLRKQYECGEKTYFLCVLLPRV